MRSYEAARGLFSFLGFMSWAVIIIGAVLAFSGGTIGGTGFGQNSGGLTALLGAAPGIILAMLGFYGLALVQMGRAGVDSAEYSQQSLAVARQQLEVSQQALQQGKEMAASYAGATPAAQAASVGAKVGYADQEKEPASEVQTSAVNPDAPATISAENHAAPALETPRDEPQLSEELEASKSQPIAIPAGKFSGV